MFDMMLLFWMALAGGTVAIIGFFMIIRQRFSEPNRKLQQRINQLEEEVHNLKKQ